MTARQTPNPAPRTLDRIGYEAEHLEAIHRAIRAPDGLVLIVGPAASGRRTALYSMLDDLDPLRRRVRTIESCCLRPVAHWRQLRVPDRRCDPDGRRWERAFVRILRGGADAILIEKIASPGIAQLAIQAAQTGHLVLSTMPIGGLATRTGQISRRTASAMTRSALPVMNAD